MSKKILWSMGIVAMIFGLCATKSFADTLTIEMVKQKVDAAAKLVETEGETAFDKLRSKEGEFRFGGGEGYIFVNSPEGNCLVHGDKPALEGKYLLDLKDVNGVYFFVQFNEIATKKGKGWVAYVWPKPGQKEPSPKVSYVVLAKKGDKKYVVGSGLYDVTLKDIKAKFPDDPVYEEGK